MKKLTIKASVVGRICALLVVLINQCLAIFGKGSLPFTENAAYQVASLIATIVIAGINCWYNQDITKVARIAGKLFDSLHDGKITEDEIESIVRSAEDEEIVSQSDENAFLIGFANGVINTVKRTTDTPEKAKEDPTIER